jgi:hypothetical protein
MSLGPLGLQGNLSPLGLSPQQGSSPARHRRKLRPDYFTDPLRCPSCESPRVYRITADPDNLNREIVDQYNEKTSLTRLNADKYYKSDYTVRLESFDLGYCPSCSAVWGFNAPELGIPDNLPLPTDNPVLSPIDSNPRTYLLRVERLAIQEFLKPYEPASQFIRLNGPSYYGNERDPRPPRLSLGYCNDNKVFWVFEPELSNPEES